MFKLERFEDEEGTKVAVVDNNPYFRYEYPYVLTEDMKQQTDEEIGKYLIQDLQYRNEHTLMSTLLDVNLRSPFIYDNQFATLIQYLKEGELGESYFPGSQIKLRIPNYEAEGWEGDYAMVTVNKPLTIPKDTTDIYKLFSDYHKNGIVEILKWQDVVHLNPNDFKKVATETGGN